MTNVNDENHQQQNLAQQLFDLRERAKRLLFNDDYYARRNEYLSDPANTPEQKFTFAKLQEIFDELCGLNWPSERKSCVKYLSEKLVNRLECMNLLRTFDAWREEILDSFRPYISQNDDEELLLEDINYDDLPADKKDIYVLYSDVDRFNMTLYAYFKSL